jgi:thioesterase domain-containing protein
MANNFGKLLLTVPGEAAQAFSLTQPVTTLGSADTNDIVLRRAQVSRAHARIECSDTGCIIYDLDSAKGTIVNNQKVKQTNLVSNDVIQLGEAILRFEAWAPPPDATIFDDAVFDTEPTAASAEPQAAPPSEPLQTLIEVQPGGARPPFFCVVARYQDVPLFRNLAQHLGQDQPFYALQPPQSASFSKAEALAHHYLEMIKTVQATGPYHLGGFNIGGIVAFEAAQQLRTAGAEVSLLALIDTPYLPGNPLPYLNFRSAQAVNRVNQSLRQPLRNLLPETAATLLTKSTQAVKELLDTRFPRVSQRLEEDYETWQTTLADQGYEVTLKAISGYKPQTYSGRITLFLATESPVRYTGAMWGWPRLAPNGLDVRLIKGSYIGILKEPAVQALAEQLKACLLAS